MFAHYVSDSEYDVCLFVAFAFQQSFDFDLTCAGMKRSFANISYIRRYVPNFASRYNHSEGLKKKLNVTFTTEEWTRHYR